MSAEAVNAASVSFKNALIERATHSQDHAPGTDKSVEASNHRNGAQPRPF